MIPVTDKNNKQIQVGLECVLDGDHYILVAVQNGYTAVLVPVDKISSYGREDEVLVICNEIALV